jgi:hypothetical protein
MTKPDLSLTSQQNLPTPGRQEDWKKIHPNVGKSSQNCCQIKKCKNIFIKAQFKNPKHLHQTPSKLLKCPQQTIFSPTNSLCL